MHKLAVGGEVVNVKFHLLETWELSTAVWSAAVLFSEPSASSFFSAFTQKMLERISSVKVIHVCDTRGVPFHCPENFGRFLSWNIWICSPLYRADISRNSFESPMKYISTYTNVCVLENTTVHRIEHAATLCFDLLITTGLYRNGTVYIVSTT